MGAVLKCLCRIVATLLVAGLGITGTAGIAIADPVDDLVAEMSEEVQGEVAETERLAGYIYEGESRTNTLGFALNDDPDIVPIGTLDYSQGRADEGVSDEALDSFGAGHLMAGGSIYGRYDRINQFPILVYERVEQAQDNGWTGTPPLIHSDEFYDENDPFDIPRWNICLKAPDNLEEACTFDNTLEVPAWYEQSFDDILNCGGMSGVVSAEDAATRFIDRGQEELANEILEGSVVLDLSSCSSDYLLSFLRQPDVGSIAGFSASIMQTLKAGRGSAASIALFSLKLLPMDVDNTCPSLDDGVTMFIKPSSTGSSYTVSCVAQPDLP